MGRILLSICAVVVAVGLGGSAQPVQPKQHPRPTEQPAKTTEKARQQRAPIMATLAETDGERQGNHQQASDDAGRSEPSPWYDLWAQSLMALWAFFQLVLTGVGIWYIRKTLIETENAVREAAAATLAAGVGAEAAREANVLLRRARADESRAWMCFAHLSKGPLRNCVWVDLDGTRKHITEGWHFAAVWKNFGKGPALAVSVVSYFEVLPRQDAPPPVFDPALSDGWACVAPGVSTSGRVMALDDDQTAAFRRQEVKVIMYSRVRYRDTFSGPDDPDHESECCIEIVHNGGEVEGPNGREEALGVSAVGPQNTAV